MGLGPGVGLGDGLGLGDGAGGLGTGDGGVGLLAPETHVGPDVPAFTAPSLRWQVPLPDRGVKKVHAVHSVRPLHAMQHEAAPSV